MPYLRGYRGGDRAGDGYCGLFCMWCCGVANESEVTVERRGRDVILCTGPSSGHGGGPARGGHHGSRDRSLGNSSDRGRTSPRVSRSRQSNNPPPVPTSFYGHHSGHSGTASGEPSGNGGGGGGGGVGGGNGGGGSGTPYTNPGRHNTTNHGGHSTSTHINILQPVLIIDRPGRPPPSRRRQRSPDGQRAGAQERGRPYPSPSRTRKQTRTPSGTSSRERGRPRSFSADAHLRSVERQRGRGSPPRKATVSYPEVVYRGTGRGSSGPSDHESPLPPRFRTPLTTWGVDVSGTGVPAQAHLPGAWSSTASTVHDAEIGEPRRDNEVGNDVPTTTSLDPGDSRVELTHPGSLVNFAANDGSSTWSSAFGSDTDAATWGSPRSITYPLWGPARSSRSWTPSESGGTVVHMPLGEITNSHSAFSPLAMSSSDSHASSTTTAVSPPGSAAGSMATHTGSRPGSRSTSRGFSTGYFLPRSSYGAYSSTSTPRSYSLTSTIRSPHLDTAPALPSSSGDQASSTGSSEARTGPTSFLTAPSSLSGNLEPYTESPVIMSRFATIPSSMCFGLVGDENEAADIASTPEQVVPRVDTRYWTTVESVADSDDARE